MDTKLFGFDLKNGKKNIHDTFKYIIDSCVSSLPKKIRSQVQVGDEELWLILYKDKVVLYEKSLNEITTLLEDKNISERDISLGEDVLRTIKEKLTADKKLILSLDKGLVLQRVIELPIVAKDNFKNSINYELDKYTPLKADDIYYDTQICGETPTKVLIDFVLVQKDIIDPILSQLNIRNIDINRVVPFGEVSSLKDYDIDLTPHKRKSINYKGLILASYKPILIIFLILLTLVTPLLFKRQEAVELQKEIAKIKQEADGEIVLWNKRNSYSDLITGFIEDRPIPFSKILEEISTIIPDSAWVEELTYSKEKISLRGASDNATGILEILELSEYFSNASFEAPLVKDNYKIGATVVNKNKAPKSEGK